LIFGKVVVTLKKFMAQIRVSEHSPRDHVYFNKSLVSHWQQYRESRRDSESALRGYLAKQRKDELEEQRRKRNLFQLYKWDLVR
jgi:hypothetical protein